jgi:drug/metabolite transporter (DMT)-like permease
MNDLLRKTTLLPDTTLFAIGNCPRLDNQVMPQVPTAFHLPPSTHAMMWAALAGFLFVSLNTLARSLAIELGSFETQFLRYLMGLLLFVPWVIRHGAASYKPKHVKGQFIRGAFHTVGLILWFYALPKIPIADTTAISFLGPIFIMIGAAWFLKEQMHLDRWVASILGFTGVMIVVGPHLGGTGGWYNLVMLASGPMFAASFLITKALTKYESTRVIVFWQSFTVSIFSLPLALVQWTWPTPTQWLLYVVCGALGSLGHLSLTKAFRSADISATQALKFLELIWAAAWGWLVFNDVPTQTTLIGGAVICAATIWIARREAMRHTPEKI